MRPLRIAVVGPLEFPGRQGGMTRHVEEVYARLAESGHDVTVFSVRALAGPEYRGLHVRTVPAPKRSPFDRLVYGLLASARAAVGRFDVVHYHSYSNSGGSVLPALTGRAVVMTVHRLEWLDEKWDRLGRAVLRANAWITHRVARAFVAVSAEFEAFVRARVRASRVVVRIPNGITLPDQVDADAPESFGLVPDAFLLAVSRLVPEKGLDVCCDALDLLAERGADLLPVAVAGRARTPTEYSARLEERVARTPGPVSLLGVQPAPVVHGLYATARALVAPSRREGNPLTVIEAMAHGLCVVASDIPPHRELLGDTGILVPVDDAPALADALARVIDDPDAAHDLGRRARERIGASEYQWDDVAARTAALLASVARDRS